MGAAGPGANLEKVKGRCPTVKLPLSPKDFCYNEYIGGKETGLDNRRLKILHLLATMPVGGAEDLVAAVVKGLNPERFDVACACIGPPGPVGEELGAAGFAVTSLGLDLKRTPARRLVAAVRRLLKDVRPDLLHTHLYHPNLYGRLAALGLGLPVVAAVHNSYTRVKFHRRVWNFLLARVTDRVLVGSEQVLYPGRFVPRPTEERKPGRPGELPMERTFQSLHQSRASEYPSFSHISAFSPTEKGNS